MNLEWDESKRQITLTERGLDFADVEYEDIPEVTPDMFARAVLHVGLPERPKKKQVSLRIDEDVLKWYREQGRGWQTRMNALLRAYMEAHQ